MILLWKIQPLLLSEHFLGFRPVMISSSASPYPPQMLTNSIMLYKYLKSNVMVYIVPQNHDENMADY